MSAAPYPILELVHDENGQFHWRVRATNGRILCHSEQYHAYRDAARSAYLALNLSTEPRGWHQVAMSKADEANRAYNVRHIGFSSDSLDYVRHVGFE